MPLPKLLMLHGALGASGQFDPLKQKLEKYFEILSPDLEGHGGREIPEEPFSFPLFASGIVKFLDDHKVPKTHIFGYSMGGYCALWMAKHFPDRVGKIFTLATKFEWNEASALRESSMLNPGRMEEKIPAFAGLLAQRHAPQNWKTVVQKTAEMMTALGISHLTESDFRSIRHQACIAVGDRDNMVTPEESSRVSAFLTGGQLRVMTNTPHPFEKMDMEKLAGELKLFFEN